MKQILAELKKVSKDVHSADIEKVYERALSDIDNAFKEISKLSGRMGKGIVNQNQLLNMWGFWASAKKNLKGEFGKYFDIISKAIATLNKNKEWKDYQEKLWDEKRGR